VKKKAPKLPPTNTLVDEKTRLPDKKSGLSFKETLTVALLSTALTLFVSLFANSFSTTLSAYLTNDKDSTFQRREKLEELLTLAYGLPQELRTNTALTWTAATLKAPKMVSENYESEDWFKTVYARANENLYRVRSIGTVYFPELDPQIRSIVLIHAKTEARGNTCIRDNFLKALQTDTRDSAIKKLFPSAECALEFFKGAEQLELEVDKLVNAARTHLRVYFFDPEMLKKARVNEKS
jgi:hypothetical protein